MVETVSIPPVEPELWLLDQVSVGPHHGFTTDVNPGDLIIWQLPENSGILSITNINNFNTALFSAYPQPIPGQEHAYMATVTLNPGSDILNASLGYTIVIDSFKGQSLQFDPKIRVVPSPTSTIQTLPPEKIILPLTHA
jgi:hypothetical protein